MEIKEKTESSIQVISPKGRIDALSAGSLEEKLNNVMEAGHLNLVVDFSGVEYISSAGLRVLLSALKKIKKDDGDIRLCSLQAQVLQVFEMAGFIQVFKILPSEKNAIDSYK